MKLSIGDSAPQFSAVDQAGIPHSLKEYAGSWVLLYFYPRDNTPGCTIEACAIRDNWSQFSKAGIVVLGVSTDSSTSHQKFAARFKLPFTLLADDQKTLVKLFGAYGTKKFMGRSFQGTYRISFLINPKGKIAKIYEKVKPSEHAKEVLYDVETLSKA